MTAYSKNTDKSKYIGTLRLFDRVNGCVDISN